MSFFLIVASLSFTFVVSCSAVIQEREGGEGDGPFAHFLQGREGVYPGSREMQRSAAVVMLAAPRRRAVVAARRHASVRTRQFNDRVGGGGSDAGATHRSTPTESYEQLMAKGLIEEDPLQRALLDKLEEIHGVLADRYATAAPAAAATAAAGATDPTQAADDTSASFLAGSYNKLKGSIRRLSGRGGGNLLVGSEALRTEFVGRGRGGEDGRINGVYIHGDVGCGKTMLMDMFYSCLPTDRKLRIHLHAFMTETYKAINQLTLWRSEGILREKLRCRERQTEAEKLKENAGVAEQQQQRPASGEDNALVEAAGAAAEQETPGRRPASSLLKDLESLSVFDVFVDQLCDAYDVICFDEFQVLDAADAAILSRLFTALFTRNDVVVVCTSNKPIDFFTSLGKQYHSFVDLLSARCDVFHLSTGFDYRRTTGTPVDTTYIQPNSDANIKATLRLFHELSLASVEKDVMLSNQGRALRVPFRAGGVALFTFENVCGDDTPMSPADHNYLASQFHTVFIVNVPKLSVFKRNEARRFITLVDELYQFNVNTVVCAETTRHALFNYQQVDADKAHERASAYHREVADERKEWGTEDEKEQLLWRFTGEEDVFAFRRVESRLSEMATREYLLLPHLNFVADDVDLSLLVGKALPGGERQKSRLIDA